jgi:hypothetical protein
MYQTGWHTFKKMLGNTELIASVHGFQELFNVYRRKYPRFLTSIQQFHAQLHLWQFRRDNVWRKDLCNERRDMQLKISRRCVEKRAVRTFAAQTHLLRVVSPLIGFVQDFPL